MHLFLSRNTLNSALLLLVLTPFVGPVAAQDEQAAGYDYLNLLRQRADMIPFQRSENLETAAENHSAYLVGNSTETLRVSGHFENPGDPFFTGNQASDRTAASGYLSLSVGENVSVGQDDVFGSIDDLMSAIYHRFGFLSFFHDEIGLGFGKDPMIDYTAYTYNSGNAALNTLCGGESFNGFGSFFVNVCAQDPDFRITVEDKNAADNNVAGQNPSIVLWPAQGDDDVPPAFFEESPDPLPDFSVSGYPVSLQFNPLQFSSVTINSFRLFDDVSGQEITNTRLLDIDSDPNFKFSELEFALFPLQRLAWKRAYRVEVDYDSDQGADLLVWKFATRNPGAPIFEYAVNGATVEIPSNAAADFYFYVPPEDGFPIIGGIGLSFPAGVSVTNEFLDGNTLAISLSGSVGQEVNYLMNDRSFTLRIGDPADIPADPDFDLTVGEGDGEGEGNGQGDGEGAGDGQNEAYYDTASELLVVPYLIVDGGQEVGLTLELLDINALTFKVGSVLDADTSVAAVATFTSSNLLLTIPRLAALGTYYSLQLQLVDAEALVLQVIGVEELDP